MKAVIRHLRRAALLQAGESLTDGQLLDSFLGQRDEAAFEALLRRHGPMVLGVCRRVLGNADDSIEALRKEVRAMRERMKALEAQVRGPNQVDEHRRQLVEKLIEELNDLYRRGKYVEAEGVATRAKEVADPNDKTAAAVLNRMLNRLGEVQRKSRPVEGAVPVPQAGGALKNYYQTLGLRNTSQTLGGTFETDPLADAEAAIKKLRTDPGNMQATESLERALKRLKERRNPAK
jgi:hypothetical protein